MKPRFFDTSPRMREFLVDVSEVHKKYEGEFVVDILLTFMPCDVKYGEAIEAPFAKARLGKFVQKVTS